MFSRNLFVLTFGSALVLAGCGDGTSTTSNTSTDGSSFTASSDNCAAMTISEYFTTRSGDKSLFVTTAENALASEFTVGENKTVSVSTDGTVQLTSSATTYVLSPSELTLIEQCKDSNGAFYEGYAIYTDAETGYQARYQHQYADDNYIFFMGDIWEQGKDLNTLAAVYLNSQDPNAPTAEAKLINLASTFATTASSAGGDFSALFTDGNDFDIVIDSNGNIDFGQSPFTFSKYYFFDNTPFAIDDSTRYFLVRETLSDSTEYVVYVLFDNSGSYNIANVTEIKLFKNGGIAKAVTFTVK